MLSLFSEPQENNSFEKLNLHHGPELLDPAIVDVTVDAHDEATVLLGVYEPEDTPRGFSIALDSDAENADSIIAQVTTAERNKKHEFILYINNPGSKALVAEARPL